MGGFSPILIKNSQEVKKIFNDLERKLAKAQVKKQTKKEWLYIGHYVDIEGNYILKIGTTNNLQRRAIEHTRNYRKSKNYTLPAGSVFTYDWFLPLSKYNTLRFEDKNRQAWQEAEIGDFVRNDRFCCYKKPCKVTITIRKTYEIEL